MKQPVIFALSLLVATNGLAQEANTLTSDNYVTQAFKGVYIEMPDYREINSGSKFIVTYEGDWPAEMQGAFEYAVKLWEEVLPMTLPINITAKIASLRGRGTILSRVSLLTRDYQGPTVEQYASPTSMMKCVLLQEFCSTQRHRFYDEITDISIFNYPDISIIYNQSLIDQFDFSLDGEQNFDKYDFVTAALRDIAIGLGFNSYFSADTAHNKMEAHDGRLTPFETVIMESLVRSANSQDPYKLFSEATKGLVSIRLSQNTGIASKTLDVYAPTTWTEGTSLRYLIPKEDPISRLLTYDFGKGYVMRDLSGCNWKNLFREVLDWRKEATTSSASGSVSEIGSTDDVLPYKGQVSLSFSNSDKKRLNSMQNKETENTSGTAITPYSETQNYSNLSNDEYYYKFHVFSPNGAPILDGLSLSVLKKDGTWDCVYTTYNTSEPITVSIENLKLNFAETEYARGTSGGLRYRLTKATYEFDNLYQKAYHNFQVKYFTRDFTPQKATIKYTPKTTPLANPVFAKGLSDDWFVDVEVGIANLEGTSKVVVEQLDEGETLPFQYEVEDFRKGYFIANLDRECSTQLTIISYNNNGYKRSNTITIPALGYSIQHHLEFKNYGDYIKIHGLAKDAISADNIFYSIKNLSGAYGTTENQRITCDQIDISNLPKGIYALSLFNDSKTLGAHKFVK